MKILIIGWYGTETIGDRGILAGILSLFKQSTNQKISVTIGSLFPFFTERTLKEDIPFYQNYSNCEFDYNIIDSTRIKALEKAILDNDMVLMGGGPLMHISQLYIIEYAFKYARKKGKKTMVFGCGIGPMRKKKFFRSLKQILNHSDEIILRDERSLDYLNSLFPEHRWDINIGMDPAAQAALDYLSIEQEENKEDPYVAINIRKFPTLYGSEDRSHFINEALKQFLLQVKDQFDLPIQLIPMHYFHVGDDDREILNQLKFDCGADQISVQQVPLSLEETFRKFAHANFTVGMRFHSVVFQTLVNRKNYVLDYTEKSIGKISGFINSVDEHGYYEDRYVSLQDLKDPIRFNWEAAEKPIDLNLTIIRDKLKVFSTIIDRNL